MNRHLSRMVIIQALFEWDFRDQKDMDKIVKRGIENYQANIDEDFIHRNIKGVLENLKTIDEELIEVAPEWPIEQVSNIDKAILRLAIYELLHNDEVPPKVVINEAVELGKSFGNENSPKFVNGVLGTLYRQSDKYNPEDEVKSLISEKELKDLENEK